MHDLDTLWKKHGPELVRFAQRKMGGHHSLAGTDAEDVVQDAITGLLARPPQGQIRNARNLLYQAVFMTCINLFRSWNVDRVMTLEPGSAKLNWTVTPDENREVNILLYRAIRQLSDRERVVAVHRLMYGMTTAEVGDILGVNRHRVSKEAEVVAAKLRIVLDAVDDGTRETPEEVAGRRRRLLFEMAAVTGPAIACRAFSVPISTFGLWRKTYPADLPS